MAKRKKEAQRQETPPPKPEVKEGGDRLRLATLAGLVLLLMISFSNWREIGRIQDSLDNRLGQIENRIGQVVSKMDTLPARGAQPPRRGPDPNRVYQIKTAGSPHKGPASAPITIAEFSDFQCPFCSRVGPTLKKIEDVYGDKVRIVWKHNPLPFHKDAPLAHAASLAADRQGKFWEYHDKLFANQKALKPENLEGYARRGQGRSPVPAGNRDAGILRQRPLPARGETVRGVRQGHQRRAGKLRDWAQGARENDRGIKLGKRMRWGPERPVRR
jgi:protein-disulfide isomerase